MKMDAELAGKTVSFAAVAALQQSSLYLGKLMIQGAVNALGTASITAFPITVGHHFDVYYRNRLLRFSPHPDPKGTVKWVNFLDKVTRTAKELV
jgi:hypothetical protein